MQKVNFQNAFIAIKEDLTIRMGQLNAEMLEPIHDKGYTEICKKQGEKQAIKRELEFIRFLIEKMNKDL